MIRLLLIYLVVAVLVIWTLSSLQPRFEAAVEGTAVRIAGPDPNDCRVEWTDECQIWAEREYRSGAAHCEAFPDAPYCGPMGGQR